jgi:hypothetical protein
LGAIGGMLMPGIVALFVGAVALAPGYQIQMAWTEVTEFNNSRAPAAESDAG